MRKYVLALFLASFMPFSAFAADYVWENGAGDEVTLASKKGKPVILHFWASWCPPCRSEMPILNQWMKQHSDADVAVISLDREREAAEAFFAEKEIKLAVNMGDMGGASRLGVRGLPTTIVIGADGEVKKRYVGDLDWSDQSVSQEVLHWLQN